MAGIKMKWTCFVVMVTAVRSQDSYGSPTSSVLNPSSSFSGSSSGASFSPSSSQNSFQPSAFQTIIGSPSSTSSSFGSTPSSSSFSGSSSSGSSSFGNSFQDFNSGSSSSSNSLTGSSSVSSNFGGSSFGSSSGGSSFGSSSGGSSSGSSSGGSSIGSSSGGSSFGSSSGGSSFGSGSGGSSFGSNTGGSSFGSSSGGSSFGSNSGESSFGSSSGGSTFGSSSGGSSFGSSSGGSSFNSGSSGGSSFGSSSGGSSGGSSSGGSSFNSGSSGSDSASVPGGVDFSQATRTEDGRLCVIKEESVETLSKDPILECKHKNIEKCHYTYITYFKPAQEEACEENFEKICQITFKQEAIKETIKKCYRPLKKVCNGQGPEECRTVYESSCSTKYVEKGPGKFVGDTKCEKLPVKICGQGCVTEEGAQECHNKEVDTLVDVPEETCDLNPQKTCRLVTKLVPSLKPKKECTTIPQETCNLKFSQPQRKQKPLRTEWCLDEETDEPQSSYSSNARSGRRFG